MHPVGFPNPPNSQPNRRPAPARTQDEAIAPESLFGDWLASVVLVLSWGTIVLVQSCIG